MTYTDFYLDEEELLKQARKQARIERMQEWLAALAVGAIMSSPLWMQAVFCWLVKECA